MLVLSRKVGEEIMIGDDIIISVQEIRGGRIRLGIEAPKQVVVHRGEIYKEVQKELVLKKNAGLATDYP